MVAPGCMGHTAIHFPKDFFWGAATASHQVEGNNYNDWSEWEKSERRLAYLNSSGLIAKHGLENFISAKACDHYSRYKEDFLLAKRLGHNATRFSIEWSRIEPEENQFNLKEIDHYVHVTRYLRDLDIEPFVTLWHWPIPTWLRNKGGWYATQAPNYFERYSSKIVQRLAPDVRFWITLNEPEIYAANSYLAGVWPPQKMNPWAYLRVTRNLIAAHRKAYAIIKTIEPNSRVGVAKALIPVEAYKNRMINILLKKFVDRLWTYHFIDKIKSHQDFIGVNHYFRYVINFGLMANENARTSDVGWELYGPSMYQALMGLQSYGKPIYVTENGLADARDEQRAWFIFEVISSIAKAIAEGVNVRGYLHWSLLDNFEWEKGFWPRFGLVEVDYNTLQRSPRRSACFYSDICIANGITGSTLTKYEDLVAKKGTRAPLGDWPVS